MAGCGVEYARFAWIVDSPENMTGCDKSRGVERENG